MPCLVLVLSLGSPITVSRASRDTVLHNNLANVGQARNWNGHSLPRLADKLGVTIKEWFPTYSSINGTTTLVWALSSQSYLSAGTELSGREPNLRKSKMRTKKRSETSHSFISIDTVGSLESWQRISCHCHILVTRAHSETLNLFTCVRAEWTTHNNNKTISVRASRPVV